MAMNRFMKAAMGAGKSAGVSQSQVGQALKRMMGQGSLVKSAPSPQNTAKTRSFATDAATGRHRSISKATADRYSSYGKTKAKNNAKRTGVAGTALAAAAMAKNPEEQAQAQAEERNPAEEKKGGRGNGRNETERRKGYADGKKAAKKKTEKKKTEKKKPDSKSFNDAFKAARSSYKSGRTDATKFTWRGKSYSIVTKDDIKKAGSKDLREYLNKGGKPKR